ncbi:IS481 family transposase [Desulfovibrio oxamicus]|uniref:IS481 family transposase n=1 Tax=Nitratidesulfovibrio oxamicus TaxID=32016 RepID=A0ABS0J9R9_9BACT|nr:IS481 family transposase [Nitratidesulfovibrio oxamicus]MBG3878686.1 IS481 family transposase [Nitratidesulfovibrio oxamicus]
MTTNKKVARRTLSLLELASDLDNVSKACLSMGHSRQQFYEIRRNYQTFGAEGLVDRLPGPREPHPNRVDEATAERILAYILEFPTHGPVRVAKQLLLHGVQVSSGGVRGVWSLNGILTRHERLLRLERHIRDTGIALNDDHVCTLERFSPEFRERHIETWCSGDLFAVETFFVVTLKGVGKIYLQSAIDCHSRYAFGRLYTSKLPLTAEHMLNESVLPFFEEHDTPVVTVLSDNGREFCGRADRHPYELFLQLEGIEYRTTRVRRRQSNGFVERLHRKLLDEHFRIQGRRNCYESLDEMQTDLDVYLHRYNHERAHQGRNTNGRTPYQAFLDGRPEGQPEEGNEGQQAA